MSNPQLLLVDPRSLKSRLEDIPDFLSKLQSRGVTTAITQESWIDLVIYSPELGDAQSVIQGIRVVLLDKASLKECFESGIVPSDLKLLWQGIQENQLESAITLADWTNLVAIFPNAPTSLKKLGQSISFYSLEDPADIVGVVTDNKDIFGEEFANIPDLSFEQTFLLLELAEELVGSWDRALELLHDDPQPLKTLLDNVLHAIDGLTVEDAVEVEVEDAPDEPAPFTPSEKASASQTVPSSISSASKSKSSDREAPLGEGAFGFFLFMLLMYSVMKPVQEEITPSSLALQQGQLHDRPLPIDQEMDRIVLAIANLAKDTFTIQPVSAATPKQVQKSTSVDIDVTSSPAEASPTSDASPISLNTPENLYLSVPRSRQTTTLKQAEPKDIGTQTTEKSELNILDAEDTNEIIISSTTVQATVPPTPTESTPTESTPTESTPTESTPTESTPTESTPTESTPTESTPTESTPTESTPTESTPTESTPTESTPTESTPTESTPTESTYIAAEYIEVVPKNWTGS